MKMSIIIGVIHMMFGVILSFFNDLFFHRRYAVFLEFLPQILFLGCIFFYLVFLIYWKWFFYGARMTDVKHMTHCAPQILILFIDMMLMSTSKPLTPECDAYMFPNQQLIQKTLLGIALVCVPIMLFGSPVYLWMKHKKPKKGKRGKGEKQIKADHRRFKRVSHKKHVDVEKKEIPTAEDHSNDFGELMIHQAIHTIEFVLSTISHTASYLRLWALSLAHAQLSEMLWEMILSKLALHDKSSLAPVRIVVIFCVWALFTVSIMVLMEGLSAFLHTLRLHWVEFMSKFYTGSGYPFRPFCFRAILETDPKEDKSLSVCTKKRN